MNVVELERAISKLKAKLITGGNENTAANVETRRRLVRLQTTKIKLKEMEEVGDVVHWMVSVCGVCVWVWCVRVDGE